jgi:hypothetical protein
MALKRPHPMTAPRAGTGIVKQTTTRIPTRFYINAAAGFIGVLIIALTVRGAMFKEDVLPCSDRYGNGTLFGMQNQAGGTISASDLQARLGGRDWGVLENTRIINATAAPTPTIFQVALPKIDPTSSSNPAARSGMGFTWLPSKLPAANAACLSYHVWLPEDFQFGSGGSLPGMFGNDDSEPLAATPGSSFSTRQAWNAEGQLQMRAMTPALPRGQTLEISPNQLTLKRNQWVKIEQEIVLNDLDRSNGTIRVWVDGKQRFESKEVVLRTTETTKFRGIVADVYYSNQALTAVQAPKDTSMRMTPFELRWQ